MRRIRKLEGLGSRTDILVSQLLCLNVIPANDSKVVHVIYLLTHTLSTLLLIQIGQDSSLTPPIFRSTCLKLSRCLISAST
jgi:hypothetical protein